MMAVMLKLTFVGLLAASLAFGADSARVARGKYLVVEVAKCGDCHTPMGANGAPDMSKWLKGSVLPFQPSGNLPHWSQMAPDITPAGRIFARWKEQGLVKFLTTGLGPSGHAADPPMPAYTLKPADAEAIVAYLKSLK
jgi:mono/diheme cytochrome c family protein